MGIGGDRQITARFSSDNTQPSQTALNWTLTFPVPPPYLSISTLFPLLPLLFHCSSLFFLSSTCFSFVHLTFYFVRLLLLLPFLFFPSFHFTPLHFTLLHFTPPYLPYLYSLRSTVFFTPAFPTISRQNIYLVCGPQTRECAHELHQPKQGESRLLRSLPLYRLQLQSHPTDR